MDPGSSSTMAVDNIQGTRDTSLVSNEDVQLSFNKKVRPFLFVASWQEHPALADFITKKRKKAKLIRRIRGIEHALHHRHSKFLVELNLSLRNELKIVLLQEESLWI
ncbi:hypothetical protein V6N13_026578 [Hibiscus sabdariffa]|uniref:Uncharacterized protein n=1 Tax=Hibiscus sabdariffa TaxID=183260 RepID=A0ABR2PEW6_9ROSI